MRKIIISLILLTLNSFCSMEVVGVFGNSGEKGEEIYESEVGEPPYSTVGNEGIYVDEKGFIYTGGKRGFLNKISPEGKTIKRYKFPEKFKNYAKYGRICKGENEIYFFVRYYNDFGLLRFDLKNENFEEIPLGQYKGHHYVGMWTATKLNSKKELFTQLLLNDKPVIVKINVETKEIKDFKIELPDIQRYGCIDVDKNDNIYLSYTQNQKNYVGKFTSEGKPIEGENWPKIIEWYYAIQGHFTVTDNFLFCSGYDGFVSRFKLNGEAYPGNIGGPLISFGGYIGQVEEKNNKIYLSKTFGILVCKYDEDEENLKPLKFIGGIRSDGICLDDKGRLVVGISYDNPVGGEFFFFDKNKLDSNPVSNISAGTYFNPTDLVYFKGYFYSMCELNHWQKKKEKQPFYIFQDERVYRIYLKETDEYTFKGSSISSSFLYLVGQDTGKIYKTKLPLPITGEIKLEQVKIYKDEKEFNFEKPFGITFDLDGNLYITNKNKIYRFEKENERFIYKWEKEKAGNINFKELRDLIVIDEDIFVVDGSNNIIIRLDLDGNYKEHFGEVGITGSDLKHLNNPTYITGEKNFIYVSDKGNLRVLKIKVK
ncbi:MAG: hypothetical protein NC827_04270 [Candidatus Omnitrophica bacterium]|nr:hypothetical protein [Candidatus Omnitrophota bacterium]MCM8802507.1 hypothetical protein [Candidatus Omnitrophota bacterium]